MVRKIIRCVLEFSLCCSASLQPWSETQTLPSIQSRQDNQQQSCSFNIKEKATYGVFSGAGERLWRDGKRFWAGIHRVSICLFIVHTAGVLVCMNNPVWNRHDGQLQATDRAVPSIYQNSEREQQRSVSSSVPVGDAPFIAQFLPKFESSHN